ncbi:MAG: hypothetical protein PHN88_04500 [Ignavibacteria bacterium]|nr:hypothetical protein [Ignavibacteria bacterium]
MEYRVFYFGVAANKVPPREDHIVCCFNGLNETINKAIEHGWKPIGGVTITYEKSTYLAGIISNDDLHDEDDSFYIGSQAMIYK